MLSDADIAQIYSLHFTEGNPMIDVFRAFEVKVRNTILEEAAKVCDDEHYYWKFDDESDSDSGPRSCARRIRALKNKEEV